MSVFGPPDPLLSFGSADSEIDFWDPAPDVTDELGNLLEYGEGPTYMQHPWDIVYMNEVPVPGICSVQCDPAIQIEQKKGAGNDGARLTLHGWQPGPVVISTKLWTRDQWRAMDELRNMIIRSPGKDDPQVNAIMASAKLSARDAKNYTAAISVRHPWLKASKVHAVIVTGFALDEGPVPQSKVFRIKAIQYMPPSSKAAPQKSKDSKNVGVDGRVDMKGPPHKTGSGPGGADHSR